MRGDVQLKVFLSVLTGIGIIMFAIGIPMSVKEVKRASKCTVSVTAELTDSERQLVTSGRGGHTVSYLTYTYTYDGDKYSFVETNSYPDVISSRRTHKMLIDPNNPFEYVYKGKKYDDVFNTCDFVGVLLFALAIFFYRLTRVRFKSYI